MSEEETPVETPVDEVTMTKAEADRLKRGNAEGEKAQRKLAAEIEELKTKLEDASVGDDELAKATMRAERAESSLEESTAKLTDLEANIEQGKRVETVRSVATRLGMKNPELASRLIGDDDQADEATAERALQGLLKSEPYLKGKVTPQRDVTGTDEGGEPKSEQNNDLSPHQRLEGAYAETGITKE